MNFKINLSGLLAALMPNIITKVVSQAAGSAAGQQVGAAVGALPTDGRGNPTKADAQAIVNIALAAAKPELEKVIDSIITKYVPADRQKQAVDETNADIEAWQIKV